jgi:hypothetical protein
MSEQVFQSQSGVVYRVVAALGTDGGFGSVVRVADKEGREFALKTLHFGVPPDVLETEAENLQRVRHENVVGYVDFGTDPEPFLVMELAEGGTLKDYINEARQSGEHFPIDTVVEWSRQLLQGLGAIHEALLHRDLKPGNVLLGGETLKIGDFGIARLAEASTREETFKGGGTPVYMPPEGWAGPEGPSPTPAYDLYSLGVVLFELTTLQLPFVGSRDELRHAHLFTEPPAPTTLRADIPLALERLVLQLLRKTPNQRGESATVALELLANVSAGAASGDRATSSVLTRLQEGASSLMQTAAEREAAAARTEQRLREARERAEAATTRLNAQIVEAADIVERSVAPLQLSRSFRPGNWQLALQHSALQLTIQAAAPRSQGIFQGANVPGQIVLFGHIALSEGQQTRGGANVVAYTTEDAPWVVHLQAIELTNNALMTQHMRNYEPFFLKDAELGEHAPWLWGGAMHVFQSRPKELTRDLLVEWLALLVPDSR